MLSPAPPRPPAHPRSRGEHSEIGFLPVCPARLIPAHAGSTLAAGWNHPPARAHPRSRGEHHRTLKYDIPGHGSSPLTRGAPVHLVPHRVLRRLIPAHAGSTLIRRLCRARSRAHPRSRGEHADEPVFLELGEGSSPLTRGAPALAICTAMRFGLIPAHAGSTITSIPSRNRSRAHPRSRGEHSLDRVRGSEGRGSSPLTRGAPTRPRCTSR